MRNIEAVIFDWAGTTVDYGCMAPVQAFVKNISQILFLSRHLKSSESLRQRMR